MEFQIRRYDRAPARVVRAAAALQRVDGVSGAKVPKRGARVWTAETDTGVIGGFATAITWRGDLWLRYCLVARWARGAGLQRRLLDARLEYASAKGLRYVMTHTCASNWPSYRNLIAAGFKLWYGTEDDEADGGCWLMWWRPVGTHLVATYTHHEI